MDTNELNRKVRYALSLDDADVVDILRLSIFKTNAEQVAAWRLKEDDAGFVQCPPEVLYAFLDGFILQQRGPREENGPASLPSQRKPPPGKAVVDNNVVLKQLRIALSLKADDVHGLIEQGGGKLTKSEVNALFRKPEARNYRRCGDQVLRWFLAGLARRRNHSES